MIAMQTKILIMSAALYLISYETMEGDKTVTATMTYNLGCLYPWCWWHIYRGSKTRGICLTLRFGTIVLQITLIVCIEHFDACGFFTWEIRSRILLVSKKNPLWI